MDDLDLLIDQCATHALYVRRLSPWYVAGVRVSLRLFMAHSGAASLRQVTREKIEAWLLDGSMRGWMPATFRSHHRNVGFLFRHLVKRWKASEDPTRGIELPKLGQALPKGLSAEQAERLLVAAKRAGYSYRFEAARNVALVAVILFAWLRKQEVRNLLVEDVDFERMSITVVQGKWKKDRVVPISSRLAHILRGYLLDRERLGKVSEYFFVATQHDRQMGPKIIDLLMRRLRKLVWFHFSAHALRHTFATLMLEGGCDIYTLSRMMGHSKITTTTIYLACSARLMAASIEMHPLN